MGGRSSGLWCGEKMLTCKSLCVLGFACKLVSGCVLTAKYWALGSLLYVWLLDHR